MKLKTVKLLVISFISSFTFIVFIYNLKFFLNLLIILHENHVLIYVGEIIFNFFLFGFLSKHLKLKTPLVFIITVITPILIDASVLITNTDKIPIRFPFASIFPLLGASLAVIHKNQKRIFYIIALPITMVFLVLTYLYIMPKLFMYTINKNSPKISQTIFENKFYSTTNQSFYLKDTAKAKCVLIECFFKGCVPCEIKKRELKKIRLKFSEDNLNIIFICDGSITNYNDFLAYNLENKEDGLTFLYDRDSVLQKNYKIKAYPFEIFTERHNILKTTTGFDEKVAEEYYNQTIISINQIINEKNSN